MEGSKTIRVNLLGTSFSIETDEKPEQVQRILNHLKQTIAKVQTASSTSDPLKLSILASMLLADELLHRTANPPHGLSVEDADFAHRAKYLIERIDDTISRFGIDTSFDSDSSPN